jgi:hypothetical protein
MTDRDTFAAAALTGLLADDGDRTDHAMPSFTARAYEWADAMLRESERTNHDAVPEAKASPSESSVPRGNGGGCGGTDKPVTLPAMGTGDIPVSRTQGRVGTILSEAEIDALEYVVEEGRIASMDDYGILRSLLVRLRPEWEHQSYEESDEKRVNTNTNRDTTPSEGSVRGEGTLTAEERAAIYRAEARLRAAYVPDDETAATLRSLLARLHSTPQTHPTLS